MYSKLFKYNPYHDARGRFTTKGRASFVSTTNAKVVGEMRAESLSKGSLADYAAKYNQPVTSKDILARLPPDAKDKIKFFEGELKKEKGTLTDKRFFSSAYPPKPTPERERLHQQIIASYLDEAKLAKATNKNGKPDAVILGGRGGSGKSAFVNGKIKEFDPEKYIELDPDHIKSMLKPPYKGWNAATVHEESKYLYNKIAAELEKRKVNVIHNVTLSNHHSAKKMVDRLLQNGYNVQGHYMFLPRQEAAYRSALRMFGPQARYVPIDVVLDAVDNEKVFDALKSKFTKWSVYDNNVPPDQSPRKIMSSKHATGGKMKKEDTTKAPISKASSGKAPNDKAPTPASDLSNPAIKQVIGIDGEPLTFADGTPITNAHFDDILDPDAYEFGEG